MLTANICKIFEDTVSCLKDPYASNYCTVIAVVGSLHAVVYDSMVTVEQEATFVGTVALSF